MIIHPQAPTPADDAVDERAVPSTPCGAAKPSPTCDDALFSTIHTSYYSYS